MLPAMVGVLARKVAGALERKAAGVLERINNIWVFGVDRAQAIEFIFSNKNLSSSDIWLKILENSDFYKRRPAMVS